MAWDVASLFVILGTHSTVRVDFGALHGNGDAVEEDDDKDHVVKHLVGDDPVAQEAEPAWGQKSRLGGGRCNPSPHP